MNIEYEVTVEDDLNAKYTDLILWLREGRILFVSVRYFPLVICVIGIGYIIWGCFTPGQTDRYALLTCGILCLFSSIFLFLVVYKPKQLTFSPFNRRSRERKYSECDSQQRQRRVNITPEEFIFATGNSETAWSWQALKYCREADKSFEFEFYSGHKRFIPKRVFISQQQGLNFQDLVEQYQNITETRDNNLAADYQFQLQDYIEAQQLLEQNKKSFVLNIGFSTLFFIQTVINFIRLNHYDFMVISSNSNYYNFEQTSDERYSIFFVSLLVFLLFFGMIFPKLNPLAYWIAKNNLQKYFVKREPKQISITPKGIAIASQNYRQYYQWQAITKTAENDRIFLLFYSHNEVLTVIPKRIFTNETELTNFRNLARSGKQ